MPIAWQDAVQLHFAARVSYAVKRGLCSEASRLLPDPTLSPSCIYGLNSRRRLSCNT